MSLKNNIETWHLMCKNFLLMIFKAKFITNTSSKTKAIGIRFNSPLILTLIVTCITNISHAQGPELNRRSFLRGLGALAAVSASPVQIFRPEALLPPLLPETVSRSFPRALFMFDLQHGTWDMDEFGGYPISGGDFDTRFTNYHRIIYEYLNDPQKYDLSQSDIELLNRSLSRLSSIANMRPTSNQNNRPSNISIETLRYKIVDLLSKNLTVETLRRIEYQLHFSNDLILNDKDIKSISAIILGLDEISKDQSPVNLSTQSVSPWIHQLKTSLTQVVDHYKNSQNQNSFQICSGFLN